MPENREGRSGISVVVTPTLGLAGTAEATKVGRSSLDVTSRDLDRATAMMGSGTSLDAAEQVMQLDPRTRRLNIILNPVVPQIRMSTLVEPPLLGEVEIAITDGRPMTTLVRAEPLVVPDVFNF